MKPSYDSDGVDTILNPSAGSNSEDTRNSSIW
jgi:hypothetical protein